MSTLTDIEVALEQTIQDGRLKLEARNAFYASSIGFCPRKQIAERAGLVPTHPPDRRSQFKMWTGTVMGKAVASVLEKSGYFHPAWSEKKFTYRNYVGRIDGYTDRILGGAIVEIKTSDDDSITRYPAIPEHYLWQGMWYCLASGVHNLLIFQLGRNQGLSRRRLFELDGIWDKKLNAHMDWMELLWREYATTGRLPDCFHQFSWEDRWCSMLEDDSTIATGGGR